MSSSYQIERKYSDALWCSVPESLLARVEGELKLILEVFKGTPEVFQFLTDPTKDEKVKLVLVEKLDFLSDKTGAFMRLLVIKRRMKILPGVVEQFSNRLDGLLGRTRGRVVWPVEGLDSSLELVKNYIRKKTGAAEIELEQEVDRSIGAGFVVKLENLVIDASARGVVDRFVEKVQAIAD